MYILELKNFYSYSYCKIEFPEFGLCLLDGPSGIGKTTIMNALGFVLYEPHSKTDCKPKHNSKLQVSVKLTSNNADNPFVIFRQMNPNLHEYSDSVCKLNGNSAQAHIINKFGSYDRWLSSTLLTHDEYHFLTLSGDEKLRVLGEICDLNNDKYERYIEYIVDQIKKYEVHLKEFEINKQSIFMNYNSIYNSIDKNDINTSIWSEEDVSAIMKEYCLGYDVNNWQFEIRTWENSMRCKLLKIKEEEIVKKNNYEFIVNMNNKIKNELANLEEKASKIIVNKEDVDSYPDKIKALKDELSGIKRGKLLRDKTYYENQLADIICPYPKYTIEQLKIWGGYKDIDIKGEISLLYEAKYYIYDYQNYQKRCSLEKLHNELIDKLNSIVIDNEIDFVTISDKINTLRYEIKNHNNSLSCPKCSSKLWLNGGKLSLLGTDSESMDVCQMNEMLNHLTLEEDKSKKIGVLWNDIAKLEKEIANIPVMVLNRKNKYVDDGLFTIESKLSKYSSINIPVDENGDMINIDNEINNCHKYQEKLRLEKKLEDIVNSIKGMDEYESISKDLNVLENEINTLQREYGSKLKLLNDKQKIENDIYNYQSQIKDVPIFTYDKLKDLDLQLNDIVTNVNLRLKQFDLQKKLKDMQLLRYNLEICENNEKTVNSYVQGMYKLKTTIHNAHHHILETNLEKINRITNKILLDIFMKPITVRLSTLKQLKTTGNIKPTINLQIMYNGIEYTSIKSLSTGEKSRVRMALLFAFAKMSKSPFLLLDESLTTLDSNSKEHVIDLIRKKFFKYGDGNIIKRKWLILIVNHEANHASYDSVYDIASLNTS